MVIKLLAGIVTFSLLSVFFSSGDMTPLSKGASKREIKHDNFRVNERHACKACNPILNDAVPATSPCGEKMWESEPEHALFIDRSPRQNLKSDGNNPLITSDHKTNCEYINLFGKQIGGVPRA